MKCFVKQETMQRTTQTAGLHPPFPLCKQARVIFMATVFRSVDEHSDKYSQFHWNFILRAGWSGRAHKIHDWFFGFVAWDPWITFYRLRPATIGIRRCYMVKELEPCVWSMNDCIVGRNTKLERISVAVTLPVTPRRLMPALCQWQYRSKDDTH